FDDRSTSAWIDGYTYDFTKADLIHVHIDPDELGRNYPPTIAVNADPSSVLAQLLHEVHCRNGSDAPREPTAWVTTTPRWRSEWLDHISTTPVEHDGWAAPSHVVDALHAAVPEDAIVLSDVGAHHNWLVQRWNTRPPGRFLHSWGFASMGFGVAG